MRKNSEKHSKILIFSPYYAPHIGGVENYTKELCTKLDENGFDVTIFTPHIPKNSPTNEMISYHFNIIRFPAFEIIPNYPFPKFWHIRFWSSLYLLTKKNSFDAIISQTRFFSTSLLAFFIAKIKKTTWLHIEHGSDFVQTNNLFFSNLAKIYDLSLGKLILRSADNLIAISESVKKFVLQLAPNAKCDVVYRGFDISKIQEIEPDMQLKERYANDNIIVYIGRLISGKGVSDLLESFSLIKTENKKCFIVGDGPEMNNLKKLAFMLDIHKDVIFFGQKTFKESVSILKIADIFVNPSYSEGLPTTVIEAVFCKKAIVATNVGGTSEIITDGINGYLVAPRNPYALKDSIEKLIKNPLLKKEFSGKAFLDNYQKFDWKKCIERIKFVIGK